MNRHLYPPRMHGRCVVFIAASVGATRDYMYIYTYICLHRQKKKCMCT